MSPQLPAVPADLDRTRAPDPGADRHGDAEAQCAGNGTDPGTLGPRNSTPTREPGEDDPLLDLAEARGWPCVPLRRGFVILGSPADWRTFAATASPSDRADAQYYLKQLRIPGDGDGDR